MNEIKAAILARLPSLQTGQWYPFKPESLTAIQQVIDETQENGFYLELNEEYTHFRKLEVEW